MESSEMQELRHKAESKLRELDTRTDELQIREEELKAREEKLQTIVEALRVREREVKLKEDAAQTLDEDDQNHFALLKEEQLISRRLKMMVTETDTRIGKLEEELKRSDSHWNSYHHDKDTEQAEEREVMAATLLKVKDEAQKILDEKNLKLAEERKAMEVTLSRGKDELKKTLVAARTLMLKDFDEIQKSAEAAQAQKLKKFDETFKRLFNDNSLLEAPTGTATTCPTSTIPSLNVLQSQTPSSENDNISTPANVLPTSGEPNSASISTQTQGGDAQSSRAKPPTVKREFQEAEFSEEEEAVIHLSKAAKQFQGQSVNPDFSLPARYPRKGEPIRFRGLLSLRNNGEFQIQFRESMHEAVMDVFQEFRKHKYYEDDFDKWRKVYSPSCLYQMPSYRVPSEWFERKQYQACRQCVTAHRPCIIFPDLQVTILPLPKDLRSGEPHEKGYWVWNSRTGTQTYRNRSLWQIIHPRSIYDKQNATRTLLSRERGRREHHSSDHLSPSRRKRLNY